MNIKLFYFNCSQHSFINIFFYSKAYGYIPPLKYVQVVCLNSNEVKEEANVES